MTLRATSHGELQNMTSMKTYASDSGIFKSLSHSSNNMGGRFESIEEIKGVSKPTHPPRRPVRAVRPVSALSASGSFLQINHLQGELVRKRKECEDLKKENKYLSNEIHMERIMMRTESELTMRNLRNLNQELQSQVKELKQKLYLSQQRATLCSRAAEDAARARAEADKSKALAETRALDSRQEKDLILADKTRLGEELQLLKKEHKDVQLLLAQAEKNYFETKLKLDRVSGEKQTFLEENRILENERNTLRHKLKELTEENVKIMEKEVNSRRRALVAEEQNERANKALQQAEQERHLVEQEKQDSTRECLSWREKHQSLAEIIRAQEELKSLRQTKACQANIKSYFLCMTESDQRVKILKNQDGTPRNFTEGDPVFISTPDLNSEDSERSGRTMYRVAAPRVGRDTGPPHFSELSPMTDSHDSGFLRRNRKVEYFWIPTDEE
ncbi:polyamine-modulated factor 1-binding protein 1 isoform X2 [Pimephales promelas]|uniref:polyamine-modulated factor 1-binding protein 1 isoform X2 n=1 Tax=Pimephales promelas TaxID=90988 RepID=UPI0019555C0B|nr:polyamine-modulated factor 1-binding protein 1 isoform X2 [Pimephales promelas]